MMMATKGPSLSLREHLLMTEATLPGGTVTLVLGDVEGSTELWESRRPEMSGAVAALARHVAEGAAAHGGACPIEQGEGDSFVIAFSRASDAVAAALELQQSLRTTILRVRVGIHTGELDPRDDGRYEGPAINRTARIRDAGHGGQVLVSQTTADLVGDGLPPGSVLDDLGEHHLRGLSRPERIWQLRHPDLSPSFPTLRTLATGQSNLRTQLTTFVGRADELAEVNELLSNARCVTLTGAGGCGKTRLAVEVGAAWPLSASGGVWFVDLAPVEREEGVVEAVADALGSLRTVSARPPLDAVTAIVADRHALVVLDNCEHLLGPAADLAEQLLLRCPDLRVLVTSREPLGYPGEVTYRVPSLSSQDAAALFLDRARLANPRLTDLDARVVDEICRRLDGLPLAIELAAARMRVFSTSQLLDALHDRFQLLTGGARTAMPRQRTLEASVDWSYALLLEPERVLLRRLSVFVGGFTLEGACAVAAIDGLEQHHVFDLLVQLIEKSLITASDRDSDRFEMLETIRNYASARLAESGEAPAVRRQHFEYFRGLAHGRAGVAKSDDERFRAISAEHTNLERALEWAASQVEPEPLTELVGAMYPYWATGRRARDGARWYAVAVEQASRSAPGAHAAAMCRHALLVGMTGDWSAARPLADEGLQLAREAGDERVLMWALLDSQMVVANTGSPPDELVDEALRLATATGDTHARAASLLYAGMHLLRGKGDLAAGLERVRESVAISRAVGVSWIQRLGGAVIAQAEALLSSEGAHALPALNIAERDLRAAGDGFNLPNLLALRAMLKAGMGDDDGADDDLAALDALCDEIGGLVADLYRGFGHGVVCTLRGEWGPALETLPDVRGVPLGVMGAQLLAVRGLAAILGGDADQARSCIEAAQAEDAGGHFVSVPAALVEALAELDQGETTRALATLLELPSSGVQQTTWADSYLVLLARSAAMAGRPEESVRVLAAAHRHAVTASAPRAPATGFWRALEGDTETRCREHLGDERFEALWSEGSSIGWEEALSYLKRGRGARSRPIVGWTSLTPTETDVVRLVTDGLSNKEVAARLFMSTATVKTHLTHVFAKLGVTSRSQLAAAARVAGRS